MRRFLFFVVIGIMLTQVHADITYVKNPDGTVTKQEILPLVDQEVILKNEISNILAVIDSIQYELSVKQAELSKKQAELNALLTVK